MTTHDENYPGPVRLRGKPGKRVRWGRKERDTAFAVMEHIMQTTPPLVIPCQPGRMEKIKRCLHHNSAVPATDGVLRKLAMLSTNSIREFVFRDTSQYPPPGHLVSARDLQVEWKTLFTPLGEPFESCSRYYSPPPPTPARGYPEVHCDVHVCFEPDCLECSDALNRSRRHE